MMDRLLTDKEIELVYIDFNRDYDEDKVEDSLDKYIAKAQDAKTASLVAQDILDELEEKCNCYPDFDFEDIKGACPRCRRNIRSKWGIEQSGLYFSYE